MHEHADPDLLLSALFFLMTQHVVQQGRQALALAIIDHLERLYLRLETLPPKLGRAVPRLLEQWRVIAGSASQVVPVPTDTTASGARVIPFPSRGMRHG